MLKSVSNRNILLACLADCPADNHARQLARFLYETLHAISYRQGAFFKGYGRLLFGSWNGKNKDIPFGSVPKYCGDEIVESLFLTIQTLSRYTYLRLR